jgi:hypothetical protein
MRYSKQSTLKLDMMQALNITTSIDSAMVIDYE